MAVTRTDNEMVSVNPATEEELGRFPMSSEDHIDETLRRSTEGFARWKRTTYERRSALLREAAKQLHKSKAEFARLITMEMGKPIKEAEAEIEKCAWGCEYYAENGASYLEDTPRSSSARESYVSFDPLGSILAIMPWNFPFWQLFRFAAPTLMAGNSIVMKHASNVPRCALAIQDVFDRSGFPDGVFQTLLVAGSTAEGLIADSRIRGVTLTGSSAAGRRVAAAAGAALKKSVLELGGSDPFIVLDDADLDAAVAAATRGRFQNGGQSCIASKRIIVFQEIAEEFTERFAASAAALVVGDPTKPATQIGPLAREDLVEALDRQVKGSIVAGAEVVLGATRPRPGYFYTPAVLARVTPEMPVYREETFGPVAAVVTVKDAEEAIRVANDTDYGLGASLWTRNADRGKQMARSIEAGSVFINGIVASDPRLPFGGIKDSGYGRELSEFGIREFTNVKTVWVGPATSGHSAKQTVE